MHNMLQILQIRKLLILNCDCKCTNKYIHTACFDQMDILINEIYEIWLIKN